nr:MAG TPA_asm: hypothetical protein [Caudoviricetes sp.]
MGYVFKPFFIKRCQPTTIVCKYCRLHSAIFVIYGFIKHQNRLALIPKRIFSVAVHFGNFFRHFRQFVFDANPLVHNHALTSSSLFRCRPVSVQSTRRNSSFPTAATKRTFLSRIRTAQADCWSSSSDSKVRCPLVLLFNMNLCNADHCIIMAFHNPTVTERHTVICSATVKAGIVRNLACLHKKFAVVVKRLSFLDGIKTNSLLTMLSTNFHTYLHPITTAVQTARHTLMNSQTSIACCFSNRLSAMSLIVRSD